MSFEESIVREAAKMGWPGRMSGILKKGAKSSVEDFFTSRIDLQELLPAKIHTAEQFDGWHKETVVRVANHLRNNKLLKTKKLNDTNRKYSSLAVAAKLVDVFTPQLTKYPAFAHLYPHLHQPIDRTVIEELSKEAKKLNATDSIQKALSQNAYTLEYDGEYSRIQDFLWEIVDTDLREQRAKYGRSRFLLNAHLWAGD